MLYTGDLIKMRGKQQQVWPVTVTILVFFAFQQQFQGLVSLPFAKFAYQVSKLD